MEHDDTRYFYPSYLPALTCDGDVLGGHDGVPHHVDLAGPGAVVLGGDGVDDDAALVALRRVRLAQAFDDAGVHVLNLRGGKEYLTLQCPAWALKRLQCPA